ncbi:MAG: hypothetical protein ABI743_13435, partial [bacterium]
MPARHTFTLWASAILALGALAACQHGSDSPVHPAGQARDPETPLVVSTFVGADTTEAPIARYQLTLSGDTAHLDPARLGAATVGQHFNVDLSDALTDTFCHDCLQVTEVQRKPLGLQLTLEVRHPFKLADDLAPPTALNRRDLWISTVKGILLADNSKPYFGGEVDLDPDRLLNADGFTGVFQVPTGAESEAFPYRVFGASGANLTTGNFDGSLGWSLNPNDPAGYLVLANDQTATAQYYVRLDPGETITFDLVVTAAFNVSAGNKTQRLTPSYFMPAGAAPEPWKVLASSAGPLEAGNPSSTTVLTFRALDWQQDATLAVDPGYPNVSNRRGLATDSRISDVTFSLPAITGDDTTTVDISGATGNGYASDPWTVIATLTNTAAATEGTYLGVAKFLDERDPQSTAVPYGTTTFVEKDLASPYTGPTEFATYAVFPVVVQSTSGCVEVTTIVTGDGDIYFNNEPLYAVARTADELTAITDQLESRPVTLPPIDYATTTVLVACTGFFDSGKGQHLVDISMVCPNASNGNDVTVHRGDPLGNCPVNDVP